MEFKNTFMHADTSTIRLLMEEQRLDLLLLIYISESIYLIEIEQPTQRRYGIHLLNFLVYRIYLQVHPDN